LCACSPGPEHIAAAAIHILIQAAHLHAARSGGVDCVLFLCGTLWRPLEGRKVERKT
jgi:hypothetical protein